MAAFLAFLSKVPLLTYPLVLVTCLWLGSRVEVRHLKNADIVAQAKRDRAVADANAKANKSASDLETLKAQRAANTVYVTKKVKDANTANSGWASGAVPASMLDAFATAHSIVNPGQLDGTMQPADAGAQDKRGASGSIRGGPGFLGRLFGPAKSASQSN